MPAPLGELSVDSFLRDHWQKKPCLVRNALPGYELPLDADDLAGLACEDMAESRLVTGSYPQHDWELRYGPFDESEFAQLPESRWSLLVQDVEKHYPPLQDLMAAFDFLPSWRLDDLMISYATTGGSVGPHVDQYDVFLFQATGQKLWRVAESFDPELLEDCPLNVLRQFEPEKEWLLKAGDMLYLPPNVAHHGIALDEGMTWSIGLRAPSAADLLLSLGEQAGELPGGGPRYTDSGLRQATRHGEIDSEAIAGMRALALGALEDEQAFSRMLGSFITRFRLAHEPVSPGPDLDEAALLGRLRCGAGLSRNPWTRLAWIEYPEGALLFAAGQVIECSPAFAITVCSEREPGILSRALDQRDIEAMLALVNGGHLVLKED